MVKLMASARGAKASVRPIRALLHVKFVKCGLASALFFRLLYRVTHDLRRSISTVTNYSAGALEFLRRIIAPKQRGGELHGVNSK